MLLDLAADSARPPITASSTTFASATSSSTSSGHLCAIEPGGQVIAASEVGASGLEQLFEHFGRHPLGLELGDRAVRSAQRDESAAFHHVADDAGETLISNVNTIRTSVTEMVRFANVARNIPRAIASNPV